MNCIPRIPHDDTHPFPLPRRPHDIPDWWRIILR